MEENKERASIASATAGTTKKCQPEVNRYNPWTSPQYPQQPDTTAFLQVKQWQCLGEGMQFEDRGWKPSGNQVIPVTTDLPAAPESLLKMIRGNCATDCASARCSCRKHGLDCYPAFGQCRGTACTNISAVLGDSDD